MPDSSLGSFMWYLSHSLALKYNPFSRCTTVCPDDFWRCWYLGHSLFLRVGCSRVLLHITLRDNLSNLSLLWKQFKNKIWQSIDIYRWHVRKHLTQFVIISLTKGSLRYLDMSKTNLSVTIPPCIALFWWYIYLYLYYSSVLNCTV